MTRADRLHALKAQADALLVDMPAGLEQRYRDVHNAIYDAIHINLVCNWCEVAPATVERDIDGVWCDVCDRKTHRDYQPGPDLDMAYEELVGK